MTPDLKRLCDAAEAAFNRSTLDALDRTPNDVDEGMEAIVRAVLMALREVGDGGSDTMKQALRRPRQHVGHRASDEVRGAYIALDAYVDHILDTKARRAAALQGLADLDKDLL